MEAFVLEPHIASTVWGGRRLIEEYGVRTRLANAAEAWLLSCHPSGESRGTGTRGGQTLTEILRERPDYLGEHVEGAFPLLVKLIDARDDLSIQVHPTAESCAQSGHGQPKTECWLILEAEPGAELVLGFQQDVTPEQVRTALADDNLPYLLRRVPVRKNDFFFIAAGTLHAIGKGILLAEVQQSSDTTYRLYDYNRLGLDGQPRPLHVEEALACMDFRGHDLQDGSLASKHYKKTSAQTLCTCPEFTVRRHRFEQECVIMPKLDRFRALLVLEGVGELKQGGESLMLHKGACVFLPAGKWWYLLEGEMDVLEILP
ncbi:MAG: class I mannose-6-phosphate isomerase [Oscillospiraceae bacterium]|jgi:mannose-6-phosphate isomerase|nr:class I mannose-6-phosphate isomerase [Oscillospiraceae bacterium]